MRGIMSWLCTSVAVGLVMVATSAAADDKAEKISPDKLPQKVKEAIKARFPGAKLTSAEKEKEGGEIVYDIELTHQGRKYEMDIKEDGTIIEIEKEITAKELPEAVSKALKAKYPKAKIKEIMEINKVNGKEEKPDGYEVTLETADKKQLEVKISLDGKTIKPEGEEKEEKDN